ncbi:histidinol-phosphatase HisJ [Alkalihalobacillus deserti]|uniref:histidinol-phosphatase HisJ n=1 Tax=Alkalihalobacillus deserti TaxID=2879466 RepID=UPI001D149613|nr:histidinol-phosphatase HisJ [Alkalihalobacillus deserti]
MIHDGHIHTPFCPHGTKDSLHKYCEAAIKHKLTGITFTEHAPLPYSFVDPTPEQDSGMRWDDLEIYLKEVNKLKKEYKGDLEILVGLEVDYIEGFEKETTIFLDEFGPELDDSILSVHFLKINSEYVCIDYSPDVFEQASDLLGSIDSVYKLYYQTVLKSVQKDLGRNKPHRIGHITLARKFHKKFPASNPFTGELSTLLVEVKKKGYELDYNGAGTVKPLCKEPYPFNDVIQDAINLNIPLVYGSDAHQAASLLCGYSELSPQATFVKPAKLRN